MRTFWRNLVGVTLLALLPPLTGQAGETQLWIVQPAPGGNLSDCPERAAQAVQARSSDARLSTSDALVRWRGGQVPIRGTARSGERQRDLWDHCFALTVDGRVVISGATLVPHSARALRFPVLQVLSWRSHGENLELELSPAFPPDRSTFSVREWQERLAELR